MAVESGKEFIQHHHHQLVSLMGIQYKSLSLSISTQFDQLAGVHRTTTKGGTLIATIVLLATVICCESP